MKRKIVIALLCAALLLLLFPGGPAAAEERLTFISVNDTLPPELINCVTTYGGLTYVPYYIFTNYGLGISYSYFSSAATAYLYTSDKQLFFELNTGETYDGDDNHYAAPAILWGGTVYLPLSTMYRFFGGFSYSNISGNEYGSILRVTTDAVLTDAEFLRAARSAMRDHYLTYNSRIEETPAPTETPVPPTPTPAPTPVWTPAPTETPEASEAPNHAGERLTLSFFGLPADYTLNVLDQNRMSSCFFLTAGDVRADPDLVRRLLGEGHSVGIYCIGGDPAAELAETSGLLFEAARTRALLAAAPAAAAEACREAAEAEGYVWCGSDYSAEGRMAGVYGVTAWLENNAPEGPSLRLGSDEDGAQGLGQLLQYLERQQYDVVCPRETDRT